MQRIGILGGTFDPPHIGHLILAEFAVEGLDLSRLLFVPAADPPHKQDEHKTDVRHRLAMLEQAIGDNPRFALSRVDVDRPGPHYSLDMVEIVRGLHPGDELFFLMGGDSLRDLPRWFRPEALIRLCRLGVMRRPGDAVDPEMHEAVLPGLAERVTMIEAPLIGISSTEIVERLRRGLSVRYLVPDAVLDYILANDVYGSE
ncbi:MAG: nicotinate (nicotinamide) nucleotide adenylyltransferase [Chloroflexi bacterium]|nr:nicotinate (nicotinamide) nucleotide adenylyltransferase [Chloroflexota bacterium]